MCFPIFSFHFNFPLPSSLWVTRESVHPFSLSILYGTAYCYTANHISKVVQSMAKLSLYTALGGGFAPTPLIFLNINILN